MTDLPFAKEYVYVGRYYYTISELEIETQRPRGAVLLSRGNGSGTYIEVITDS